MTEWFDGLIQGETDEWKTAGNWFTFYVEDSRKA